jgi:hypothetical protein
MVGVAQLVEHWLVVPVAAGSSPVVHPMVQIVCTHIHTKRFGFGRTVFWFRSDTFSMLARARASAL